MKQTAMRCAALALLTSTLLLAGCSILTPQPDMSHFFTLAPIGEATAQPAAGQADTSSTMLLGLGPIKLPPYLDRHEIATRLSPTQLTYSSVDLWAEPLTVSVSRVLLQNLSYLLGTERIVMYPWSNAVQVDFQIEVELLNFEVAQQREARLLARYGILGDAKRGTRQVLVVRETAFSHPTTADPAAAVAALSATLSDLSQEIAAIIRQLPKPQLTPAATRGKS